MVEFMKRVDKSMCLKILMSWTEQKYLHKDAYKSSTFNLDKRLMIAWKMTILVGFIKILAVCPKSKLFFRIPCEGIKTSDWN
jgi:hypothetical protein